jgi:protein-L-isoaspartate O-methyltransferase
MSSRLLIPLFALAAVAFGQPPTPIRYPDVPYVPTPQKVVDAMLALADVHKSDFVVDLGSGDGRIVISAAKRYGASGAGVELDRQLVRQSEQNARDAGVANQVRFIEGDLFDYDLRGASVVTIYLLPGINLRLKAKLFKELAPGARVVSHKFDMGDWRPNKTVEVDGEKLFLWIMPEKRSARIE